MGGVSHNFRNYFAYQNSCLFGWYYMIKPVQTLASSQINQGTG